MTSGKKMLTIDLLKGSGIPTRSNPDKIALMAITVIIPVIIAVSMVGIYWKNTVLISVQKQNITNCEKSISRLSQVQMLLEKSEKEKKYRDDCLAEVAKSLAKYHQWTPAIIEVVKLMPDSIILSGLDIKQNNIRKTVPAKKGGADVEVTIPVTKLKITVTEKSASGHGQIIRKFQDDIRSSSIFGPLLDNIIVSQGIDTYKDQDVVSYQIECTFKQ
jgi:hypothetical protein